MYGHFSVGYFCKLFGKSRQAFYDQKGEQNDKGLQDALVLKLVAEIRDDLPRLGVDKLHFMLRDAFKDHGIKMGRDALYALMGRHGLLIRFRRRRPYTTNSDHLYNKYPNLIRGFVPNRAGQLWVSDITYLRHPGRFSYLSIVTDAYSHKIVGYKLHATLHSEGAIDALIMAANDPKRTEGLIHHSDRGVQYCCHEHVKMINHYKIRLSMTENGDPYENAIAERVNGILKHEFGLRETFASFEAAQQAVDEAIRKYNSQRIHDSCNRLTPDEAHEQTGVLKRWWKKKKHWQAAPLAILPASDLSTQ